MILPPIDSLSTDVKRQDLPRFKSAFLLLTNTQHTCHRATKHEFNVIRVPTTPSFSNQEFSVHKDSTRLQNNGGARADR